LSQTSKRVSQLKKRITGSCPESLMACGQAILFVVAGSNPPGSVSTSLSDSSVSVSLIHACGGITLAYNLFIISTYSPVRAAACVVFNINLTVLIRDRAHLYKFIGA
jgi:hypothetical protein